MPSSRKRRSRLLRESRWSTFVARFKERPGLFLFGGLALGAVGVGIALLLLHFVIQPFSRPETRGYVTYAGEHFKLWYDDESAYRDGQAEMHEVLEREYVSLVALMEIDESILSDRTDVFIHDSIQAMQESIMQRKAYTVGAVFTRPFDVLVGESPRRALAEVLLYYGWGQSFSPALYTGALQFLTEPDVQYMSIVKAVPGEMRHSLIDLCTLESLGSFPATMYQALTGPTSIATIAAYVDLVPVRQFFLIPASLEEAQKERLHVFEAAALVEFLVEYHEGMAAVARAWGTGQLEAELQRAYPEQTIEEMNVLWWAAVEAYGDVTGVAPMRRANLLLEGGFAEEAYQVAELWMEGTTAPCSEELATAARAALSVGAFDEAAWCIGLLDESVCTEYESLLAIYDGWERWESEQLVVLAPASEIENAGIRVEAEYRSLCDRVGTSLRETSGVRPFFFVYIDAASLAIGGRLATSNPVAMSSIHLTLDEDSRFTMAEPLLARMWAWWPVSPLARIGAISALSSQRDELVRRGAELFCNASWERIGGLSTGASDKEVLRTELGLLVSQIEALVGPEAVRAVWTAGKDHGRISLEATVQSVTGLTTRTIEDQILFEVIDCSE